MELLTNGSPEYAALCVISCISLVAVSTLHAGNAVIDRRLLFAAAYALLAVWFSFVATMVTDGKFPVAGRAYFPLEFTITTTGLTQVVLDRNPFVEVFGDCGDPCRITLNGGGSLYRFWLAARSPPSLVIIDGECDSACAFFADLARDHVCVTPRAWFGFHKTSIDDVALSRETLIRWVLDNGGFPPNHTGETTKMRWPVTTQFWTPCASELLADRGAE